MKMLIVCPRLCHGGAERVAVLLANGFAERGHEVTFFADLYEDRTYVLDESVLVRNLVPQTHNKLRKWGGAIRILRKHLKKEKPDVVIGIMSLCSFVARIAAFGTGIPVVATEHNSFERPASAPMPFFLKLYKFYLCRIFSCVTVLTEADKKVVETKLSNVVVMPNPLATTPGHSVSQKSNVVLAAGRVDNWHYKGFDVLLQAWVKLVQGLEFRAQSSGWKLQIAGVWRDENTIKYLTGLVPDGEWKAPLSSPRRDGEAPSVVWRSEKYHIEFLGFRKDVEKLYQDASIFVLSSRYEGFGLVLIEAMSQGCAPVACDYKGRQREIIAPQTPPGMGTTSCGILCEPDDVDALAAALKKMIEDEEYRTQVQRNAIERSKFYDMEHTMDRWEAFLNLRITSFRS